MSIQIGDEVAIMPAEHSPADAVLAIARVVHSGSVFIQLSNSRLFATFGRRAIGGTDYIVPATDQHRDTLTAREPAPKIEPIILPSQPHHRKHPGRAPGRSRAARSG